MNKDSSKFSLDCDFGFILDWLRNCLMNAIFFILLLSGLLDKIFKDLSNRLLKSEVYPSTPSPLLILSLES